MADRLMIVTADTEPANVPERGAPSCQGTVAAAMAYEVGNFMTRRAGGLAIKGVAEERRVREGSPKRVDDVIGAAREAGVEFRVYAPTLERWAKALIPAIGADVISQAMDDGVATVTC
jgi:predicted peroxiredoxin